MNSFYVIWFSMMKIFILSLIGFLLHKFRLINDEFIELLSRILIAIFFPALIITKFTSRFDPSAIPGWWMLPVLSLGISLLGVLIGWTGTRFFPSFKSKREFISGATFQNCGYLPMAIIVFTFTGITADKLLITLFLFILGFNLIFWAMVPIFLAGKLRFFRLKNLFTPPVLAISISIGWVFLFGDKSIPRVIFDPLHMMGQAVFPLALFTLGAYLHAHRAYRPARWAPLFTAVAARLIIIPALAFPFILTSSLHPDYKFLLCLEVIMPSAVSLVVIGASVKADTNFLSSLVLYTHLFGIVTIPAWLYIFNLLG